MYKKASIFNGTDNNVLVAELDLLFIDAAVIDVQKSFDLYWNNKLSYATHLLNDHQVQPNDIKSMATLLKDFEAKNRSSLYLIAVRDDN